LSTRFKLASAGLLCLLPAVVLARPARPVHGRAVPMAPCLAAISAVEQKTHLPPELLHAIGLVESGRVDPARGTVVPWPWTIDVGGIGYFYATEADAIAAVQGFQAGGVQSIDVGCMQINLLHHPDAFRSLTDAFDPATNAAYAARFLLSLYRETNSWPSAAAAYHSRTPDIAASYEARVMTIWPLAERYGGMVTAAVPRNPILRVDPYHVATPQFAARLVADARARAARDAAMLGPSLQPRRHRPAAHRRPARLASAGTF